MAEVGIFVGTMYGNALLVAEEAQAILSQHGHQATVFEDPTLADWEGFSQKIALVVTSTTGQGELPSSIVPLYEDIHARLGHQPTLRYGVIGLGDSSYSHFCGGAKKFDALLQEQGASRLGEPLFIDAVDHPEPETVAIPWVEAWVALLN
ncbi:flavodoxin [Siccibacter turicensis]|uniref:flavodoxin n=1 Tax=Siccibacter turicensis TaxID=357233 RepID=UPI002A6A376A|nr:flavodoxin [Siccibacter turicensis]MDY0969959.1 flavodoxin [Siccibacter turicensis]